MTYKYSFVGMATLALANCAVAPVYAPIVTFEGDQNEISNLVVNDDALPEKVKGFDVPTDYSAVSSATVNNMVNTGLVSPAAGAAGGLIAGLIIAGIDASVDANRNSKINAYMESKAVDIESVFSKTLTEALMQRGYNVDFVEVDSESDTTPQFDQDAMLKVKIERLGFEQRFPNWLPMGIASVELVSSEGEVLLDDNIVMGGTGVIMAPAQAAQIGLGGGDAIVLPFRSDFLFKNTKEIVDETSDRGVEAIHFVLESLAGGIADSLPEGEIEKHDSVASIPLPVDSSVETLQSLQEES